MSKIINFRPTGEEKFPQKIVGESFYQDNLHSVVGPILEEKRFKDDNYTAHLILDDDNPNDRGNAIRIEINNLKVGFLSRTDAKKYRKALANTEIPVSGLIGACRAAIYGKRSDEYDEFTLGVWLDIDLNNLSLAYSNKLTRQAVEALRTGDNIKSQNLLKEAIQNDPRDWLAWLLLADIFDQPDRREYCIKRVQYILA